MRAGVWVEPRASDRAVVRIKKPEAKQYFSKRCAPECYFFWLITHMQGNLLFISLQIIECKKFLPLSHFCFLSTKGTKTNLVATDSRTLMRTPFPVGRVTVPTRSCICLDLSLSHPCLLMTPKFLTLNANGDIHCFYVQLCQITNPRLIIFPWISLAYNSTSGTQHFYQSGFGSKNTPNWLWLKLRQKVNFLELYWVAHRIYGKARGLS